MRNTVEKNSVSINNLRAINPRTPILQNRKHQIRALETLNCNITQRSREDDIARNDVVLEHLLQRCLLRRFKNRSNGFECLVGRHEDGEVGDIEAGGFGAGEAEVDGELGGFESGVHGEVAGAVGEELEGRAEGEDRVNFVDGYAFAEHDVLGVCVSVVGEKLGV